MSHYIWKALTLTALGANGALLAALLFDVFDGGLRHTAHSAELYSQADVLGLLLYLLLNVTVLARALLTEQSA